MRVTSTAYYNNIYKNNSKINDSLFDVNKQIASGLKIQYASDNVGIFTETMRLDNELTELGQIKKSADSGYKVSNQTDVVLNEFTSELDRIKTLLIRVGNDTNDVTSRKSIANELRAIEGTLKTLANTSINGKYLFSGSKTDVKPINDDGTYNGNDASLKAFLGSKNLQQFNVTGSKLFLGEESSVRKSIVTNVVNNDVIFENSALQPAGYNKDTNGLSTSSTIRDLMGDTDNIVDTVNQKHFFYIRGVQSNGTAFKTKISMRDDETIGNLLTHISNSYSSSNVKVELNDNGQIVVTDTIKGSSKLDFHMVGATDYSGGAAANVLDIDNLNLGTTDYATAAAGTNPYIKEFIKSPYSNAMGIAGYIDGISYDRTMFTVSGNSVSSNVAQIDKNNNNFATSSTKLLDVASGSTLNGKQFTFTGTNVSGVAFNAQIDLSTAGSTFSLDGGTTNYSIFDVGTPRTAVNSDEMTYQQLMDVVNMVVSNSIPATTSTDTDYDTAIETSQSSGRTTLSYDGKITFKDLNILSTKATIGLYDSSSNDFSVATGSVLSFNANNALIINDAKTDFFKTINEAIKAVEDYKNLPDHTVGDMRNVGTDNAISMIIGLQDHLFRTQSIAGAQSNRLESSIEKTNTLEISTLTLRSQVVDTDLAESALMLQQLTTNYQAMLSTVGKVSKLSLVNYL